MLNEFYIDLRRFIEANKTKANYGASAFYYQVKEDEVNDPSLLSFRAYGTRRHSDVVVLACGNSFSYEPLPLEIITLPNLSVIIKLQKQHGVV